VKPFEQFILWIKIILVFIFLPLVLKAQTSQTVNSGSQTAIVNFPVTTCTYNWTNSNSAIGLAASGIGDIPAFTATNATGSNIIATITATPTRPTPQPPLLYIPNFNDNNVSVIDANTYALITTVPVGTNPYNVMVSHDYNRVYVANQGSNTVSVIYMPTNRVLATVPGFSNPGAMAVTQDNLLTYVANTGSNTVSIISNITYTIVSTITVGPHPAGLALSSNDSKLYVTNNDGTISIVNTATSTVTTTGPIVSNLSFVLLSPDDSKLYVADEILNKIVIINAANNTVAANIPVGSVPNGITISPDGSRLYVATPANNNVAVINTATNTVINNIPVSSAPTGVSISGDGSLLYVANSGSNNVSVIDVGTSAIIKTINVGAKPYAVGNFYLTRADCGAPITFNITVNAATGSSIATTGTPSSLSTTYGTPSSSTNFMVSGANISGGILVTPPSGFEVSIDGINYANTITVPGNGTISPTKVYIRLKQTDAAGIYTGNIVLSSAGASPVNVTMPSSTVSPLAINIYVFGSKHYGDVINNFVATTSNFNFSVINAGLKNGETVASLDISFTGGNTATDPPGSYNNVIHVANLTGSNGFLLSNYTVNYQDGPLTVLPAPLTITANNVNKIFGTTLTNEVSSTAFTTTGLQNSETVSSIAVTYGNGGAANAAIGTYNGSVVPSAAVGGNGFLSSNYAINYVPGTLSVIAAGPSITTTAPLQPLTTVYGTPSASTSFNVSGSNLTAGILVTPPAGFEVSADNVTFSNTVTIGSAGTVASTTVYIRLKQTTFVGSYSGNISSKSAGASDGNQAMPASAVTPAPLLITANDATKVYGNSLTGGSGLIAFTVSGLKNAETVGTVTIAYGSGAAATANAGNYSASVTPSAITGGTFTASNYTPAYQSGTITVTPAPLTVTADDKNKLYGDVNPAFTVSYTGFVNGDDVTQLTTPPVANTTATQASQVGQYPITVSGGAATNYTFAYVSGTLNVDPVPFSLITIPNTFTPNGDGINDTWNITNLNTYPKTTVEILNRYGIRIFFSNNYPTSWDGSYNGVKVPEGTYYYIITGVNGKPLTGYVAVIR
jgi:gliding motility-associated-like protein